MVEDDRQALDFLLRYSALGVAAGVLAHDLCSPLTILSGQIQMLAAKSDEDPALACRLASMTRQVQRIQKIVNDLGELSAKSEDSVKIKAISEAVRRVLHNH
jgi:signal transduction histidine kinase